MVAESSLGRRFLGRRFVVLLTMAFLLMVSPGHAGDDVMVDPGGLSDKEYALPIDAARSAGASGPTDAQGTPLQGKAPVFGEGVTPASSGRVAGSGKAAGTGSSRRATGDGAGSTGTNAGAAGAGRPTRQASPAPSRPVPVATNSAVPPLVGVGIALLLLGLGAGAYLLRPSRRTSEPNQA